MKHRKQEIKMSLFFVKFNGRLRKCANYYIAKQKLWAKSQQNYKRRQEI